MAKPGVKALTKQDVVEVADLYRYGLAMRTLELLYNASEKTIRKYLRAVGVPMRTKRVLLPEWVKSNRRRKHGFAVSDPFAPLSIDQLVHARARELQDTRIAQRPAGASTRSYRARAS
jgi:hypothetical protein